MNKVTHPDTNQASTTGPSNDPTNIAFRIDSSRLEKLLEATLSIDQPDYHLLGILVRFKEEQNNIGHLIMEQIYIHDNQFKVNSANFVPLNDNSEIYQIVATQSINPFFVLSDDPEGNANDGEAKEDVYLSLDKHNDNTELVFFSIDQIRHIIQYHQYVIVSGCELHLGRKLAHNEGAHSNSFSDPYFTLKMEGFTRILDPDSIQINQQESSADTHDAQGPEVAIGFACPPAWYTVEALRQELLKLNIPFNYNDLLNSFLNETGKHLVGMLIIIEKLSSIEIKISARGTMPAQQPNFAFPQTCTIERLFESSPPIVFFNPNHNSLSIDIVPIISYSSWANGNLVFGADRPIPKEGLISGSVILKTFSGHILKDAGTIGKVWWGSNLAGPIGTEIGAFQII